jgi:LPS export ABC transporter permease LptG/LPS export ABC transporter permease LptF
MLRTIDRYVIREVLPPFFLALLIFTFILELPPLMNEMEKLVAKGVPWQTVGHIVLLLVPQALGLTIPMALLVGLLIGLGRMSADRESVALLACGVSPYRLLRPVILIAALATAATMFVMIETIPNSNQKYREILFQILSKKVESEIQPRVFYQQFPNWVLYPRDEAAPGETGWRDLVVADTSKTDGVTIYMARKGRVVLDAVNRTVELVLTNGTQYSPGAAGETNAQAFPKQLILRLDPNTVFPQMALPPGLTEKTIRELRRDIADKVSRGESTHNEYMAIHAKFSIPAACVVFAVIALALGLTVARGGKLGGFVVGIGVIFTYYIVMFLAESMAKGHRIPAEWARWVPNLVLGPFGIVALFWRARHAEGRMPFGLRIPMPALPSWVPWRKARVRPGSDPGLTPTPVAAGSATRRKGVVLVLRIPHFNAPGPSLLDRYISKLYLRISGLSFLSLLGLFYISTFIDRSDKMFKGQATMGTIGQLLVLLTPQFIYYVIPIATLLSVLVTFGVLARSSELTVMKACGVSLYRTALSVVILSLGFSAMLFALEQRVMASANRQAEILDAKIRGRQPRTESMLLRRWTLGSNNVIYHYDLFDPQRNEMFGLTMFQLLPVSWTLGSETHVQHAVYREGTWQAEHGWVQDFTKTPSTWRPIDKAPLAGVEPPKFFASEEPDADFMTVTELQRYINHLSLSGFNTVPLMVELQRKLAFPLVTLVMTLLAVPFGVGLGRHGALYGIGLGIVIALSYWILISAFVAIGRAGLLPPLLAGWAPNILVIGCAAYLFLRART